MIVEEHRVAREGKKDKVWMEVKFEGREWAFILIAAMFLSLSVFTSGGSSALYRGNLTGVIMGGYLVLAIFVYVVWFFMSTWAIYHARKKGTVVREAS